MVKLTFLNVEEGTTFNVWAYEEQLAEAIEDKLRSGVVMTGIVPNDDYDDPYDMICDLTDGDPMTDLTIEDAAQLIEEGKRQGYEVPDDLTPELFLCIYNDMKDEEE